jgi:YD repeat-containing protein
MGRLAEKKANGVSSATFEYAPGGQRWRMVDNKGTPEERTTRYAYDESGRLRVKQSPEGTLSYAYDLGEM